MADPLPDELLNRVTWKIPNALVIIGSRAGGEWNGMTASWVTQVSMAPVLIGVGIDNTAVTHRLITAGGSFTVNLWSSEETRVFVEAVAYLDCAVRSSHDFGTHTFFVGEVVDAGINDDDARPAAMSDTRMKYGGVQRH